MAKDSRNKWDRVLWNDINVRLLHHVQLAGNKYMLAAAYLLHISPVICYQLIHTEFYRYCVISAHCHSASLFYHFLPANTSLVSKSQSLGKPHSNTVHVRLTTALLSVTL